MEHFKLIYMPFTELSELKQCQPDRQCFGFLYNNGRRNFILIDSEATPEQQHFTLKHELAHLALGHLAATRPLAEICTFGDDMFGEGWEDREHEADQFAEEMTEEEFTHLMQYAI